jgi:hypothetical protein
LIFCASSNFWILPLFSVTQTRVPLLAVPTYFTLFGSNIGAAWSSSSGPMIAPGMTPATEVPSFGAMLWMYCAALALPAPGMFFTTTVGSPGMWRPR